MSSPFYEIYRCLCQRAGKSDNAAAAEIGLSNSTITTWRQGAVPRRPTLKKVAAYFGVTEDFLMGYTIDAQIMVVESKLQHLRAAYDFSEESEQAAVLQEIESMEKTYDELCARKNRQEKAPTPEGGQVQLSGTYLRLAKGAQELGLDDDDVDAILALYAKHLKKNQ